MRLDAERKRKTAVDSFGELWRILIEAVKDGNAGEVVCLLDAVDECDEENPSSSKRCVKYTAPNEPSSA